jgi:non-heme chloroperoxidase
LFELVGAKKDPASPTAVDTTNARRGPLLIIGGGRDHIVAESVSRQAAGLYGRSTATTEYHVFADRGHSLIIDKRWRDVADFTLDWIKAHPVPGRASHREPDTGQPDNGQPGQEAAGRTVLRK